MEVLVFPAYPRKVSSCPLKALETGSRSKCGLWQEPERFLRQGKDLKEFEGWGGTMGELQLGERWESQQHKSHKNTGKQSLFPGLDNKAGSFCCPLQKAPSRHQREPEPQSMPAPLGHTPPFLV